VRWHWSYCTECAAEMISLALVRNFGIVWADERTCLDRNTAVIFMNLVPTLLHVHYKNSRVTPYCSVFLQSYEPQALCVGQYAASLDVKVTGAGAAVAQSV
jgi:hypothetical protein